VSIIIIIIIIIITTIICFRKLRREGTEQIYLAGDRINFRIFRLYNIFVEKSQGNKSLGTLTCIFDYSIERVLLKRDNVFNVRINRNSAVKLSEIQVTYCRWVTANQARCSSVLHKVERLKCPSQSLIGVWRTWVTLAWLWCCHEMKDWSAMISADWYCSYILHWKQLALWSPSKKKKLLVLR